MADPHPQYHKARKRLRSKKLFTITQLCAWLSVSAPTARRRLAAWETFTSYNKNGRYYTFADIPEFDEHGLWRWQGVFFSRHGNLVKTVVHLVNSSEAGYSGEQLEALLELKARSFLAPLRHRKELYREKIGGRFIWFAADPAQRRQQRDNRRKQDHTRAAALPSDAQAVLILAALIHSPACTPAQLARAVGAKGIVVTTEQVENLLRRHDLKKTAASPS